MRQRLYATSLSRVTKSCLIVDAMVSNYDRTGKAPMQTSKISTPRVRFIRPVNYNVPVAPYATAGAVCLSPLRQDRPCKEFGVQADLNNGSWVAVGFQGTNPTNGFQLLAGQGWIFSVSGFGENSQIIATPMNWVQGLDMAQQSLIGHPKTQIQLMLNVNDFWAAGNGGAGQNLIIFHMIMPEVGA